MGGKVEFPSPKLAVVGDAMEVGDPAALDAAMAALDPEDWQELERLIGTAPARFVRSTCAGRKTDVEGEVVILPGIMGSDLGVIGKDGTARVLWFNPRALTSGGLAMLRLPLDGSSPQHEIVAGGPLKLFYLPLQMTLNQRWRTRVWPFDWRQDITLTADLLQQDLDGTSGKVVHLVAHSMGGLVCRTMIARHPEDWARIGGRLIMLGTPNFGSFAPALAMTGKDLKLRLLALLDPTLKKRDISAIVGTFAGLVQMLPSRHGGLESDVEVLYREGNWRSNPVTQAVLDRAAALQDLLDGVVDENRMVCIAGYGHRTVDGVRLDADRFSYRRSTAGDGTVPYSLSCLPGVPTYWTQANHGSLVKDPQVMLAVDDLLAEGATQKLTKGDEPPHARGQDSPDWVIDSELDSQVQAATTRLHSLGRDTHALGDVLPSVSTNVVQVPIRIEVVWGGIAQADADAIAVGHYVDVYPTAAELAIDKAISGDVEDRRRVLHAATARGVLKGALGDVFAVPWQRRRGGRTTVLVLGLGRPGTFQLPQHEVLIRNMVWSAERLLKAKTIATVLIGAGAGNLSVDAAVGSVVRSLDAAVGESELTGQLELIRIVESDLGRARTILEVLTRVVGVRDRATSPAIIDVVPDLCESEGGEVSVESILEALIARCTRPTAPRRSINNWRARKRAWGLSTR